MNLWQWLIHPNFQLFILGSLIGIVLLSVIGLVVRFFIRKRSLPLQYYWCMLICLFQLITPVMIGTSMHFDLGWELPNFSTKQESITSNQGQPLAAYDPTEGSIDPDLLLSSLETAAENQNAYTTTLPLFFAILSICWLVISLMILFYQIKQLLRINRLSKQIEYRSNAELAQTIDKIANSLNLKHSPLVYFTDQTSVPQVTGLFNPKIIIPIGLREELTEEQFQAVLYHEMSHIAQADIRMSLIQMFTKVLCWWNPFNYHLDRHLNYLREEICDNHVLIHQQHGRHLAQALLLLLERIQISRNCYQMGMLSLAGYKQSPISQRIQRLLGKDRNMNVKLNTSGYASLLLACVAITGLLLISSIQATESDATETNGANTDEIIVIVPPKVSDKTYTVKAGDTLLSIAKKHYGNVHAFKHIADANNLKTKYVNIEVGQELKLPILPVIHITKADKEGQYNITYSNFLNQPIKAPRLTVQADKEASMSMKTQEWQKNKTVFINFQINITVTELANDPNTVLINYVTSDTTINGLRREYRGTDVAIKLNQLSTIVDMQSSKSMKDKPKKSVNNGIITIGLEPNEKGNKKAKEKKEIKSGF